MRAIPTILLAIAIAIAVPTASRGDDGAAIPAGTIVERVVCRATPDQSYALYLPSGYTPSRRWPILYCFDPDARGRMPVEQFEAAAEKYGWIVVGSHNSKNGKIQDSMEAGKAMWADTHERFSIDDRRIYATGFSGGARMAVAAAYGCGGCIAGVIACGAGFSYAIAPPHLPPAQAIRFAYFATIGTNDFNFPELRTLNSALDAMPVPHRLARFDGTHEWAPSGLCVEAVAWMETEAMKTGARAREDAMIESLWAAGLERARAEEESKHPFEAYLAYAALADQFKGLRNASEAEAKAAALRSAKEVKEALKQEDEQIKQQQAIVSETVYYGQARNDAEQRAVAIQEFRRRVEDLKSKAQSETDSPGRRVARRALHQIFAYFFEGAADFTIFKKYAQARDALEIAADIAPKSPGVFFELACARARVGDRKKALEALKLAVEKGYDDPESLRTEPALEPLRDDAEYRRLIEAAGKNHAGAGATKDGR